jgi:hypothetical protein
MRALTASARASTHLHHAKPKPLRPGCCLLGNESNPNERPLHADVVILPGSVETATLPPAAKERQLSKDDALEAVCLEPALLAES